MIIILLSIFLGNIFFSSKSDKQVSKINDLKFDLIDDLKKIYPNQSEYFWINIESCYKHSVVKSEDPSIILMIYDEESANTYSKLSREVLNYLDKIYKSNGHVLISTKNDKNFNDLIERKNSDDSKLYVDSKLSEHFESGGKLALIEDVQQFPAHSMVLFYAYGDEKKYAKFPGVLIFMSLKLDEILDTKRKNDYSLKPKKLREFAESYMFNMWSKWIREDQLRPLFTRIANNVILVNNE